MQILLFILLLITSANSFLQAIQNQTLLFDTIDVIHTPQTRLFTEAYLSLLTKKDIKKRLADGAHINGQDINGRTALMIATRRNDPDGMELLIAYDANPNIQDVYGWTALMYAASLPDKYHKKIVAYILLNAGANPYLKSYDENKLSQQLHSQQLERFGENFIKKQINWYANKTFFTIDPELLQDPDIQQVLKPYERRKKQQEELLLKETPLPSVLIDIISDYSDYTEVPPASIIKEKPKKKKSNRCVIS